MGMVRLAIGRNWYRFRYLRAAELRLMDWLDLASLEALLLQSQHYHPQQAAELLAGNLL